MLIVFSSFAKPVSQPHVVLDTVYIVSSTLISIWPRIQDQTSSTIPEEWIHGLTTYCFSLQYHYHNAVSIAIPFCIFFPEFHVVFISLSLVLYTILTHLCQPCSTAYLRDMYISSPSFLWFNFPALVYQHHNLALTSSKFLSGLSPVFHGLYNWLETL